MNKQQIKELENHDWSELEGKEVMYISHGIEVMGIVDGCDYWVGITISKKYDRSFRLYCLSGPLVWDKMDVAQHFRNKYPERFLYITNCIKNGELNFMGEFPSNDMGYIPSSFCAFSQ
jgi:hypothetical protein